MWEQYRKKTIQQLRPYEPGEPLDGVSIGPEDVANGSPKAGDFIARDAMNPSDQWLVSAQYVADHYERVNP